MKDDDEIDEETEAVELPESVTVEQPETESVKPPENKTVEQPENKAVEQQSEGGSDWPEFLCYRCHAHCGQDAKHCRIPVDKLLLL